MLNLSIFLSGFLFHFACATLERIPRKFWNEYHECNKIKFTAVIFISISDLDSQEFALRTLP